MKHVLAVFFESSVKLSNADGMVVCNYDSIEEVFNWITSKICLDNSYANS